MCGRYNVTDSAYVRALMDGLGVPMYPRPHRNVSPGDIGQFVVERGGQRLLMDGYWSLMIERRPDGKPGYQPRRDFQTFNARSDRLESSKLWKSRYRLHRAIVPVAGYFEWHEGQCYYLETEGRAQAMGALFSTWQFEDEVVASYALITLAGHPKLAHIHDKSLPLMLEPKVYDAWLDPGFHHVDAFHDLLNPVLRHAMQVTPVISSKVLEATGGTEFVPAD